ncbi:MAG TPA: ferrous iron transporter B [Clostridia bacterium]|nr:ferrous iron transporter B [Clostridia bacterium]
MKKVLLMGNPNVGKSVLFSQLTGARVIISNYPGTSVEYTKGLITYKNEKTEVMEVIDVPGTYDLEPSCKAEEVAVKMIPEGDVVINVLDSTNLERNLYLTLSLLEKGVPMVIALNMWDEAVRKGIKINFVELEKILGVPVVPTTALSGVGLKRLVASLTRGKARPPQERTREQRWSDVGKIIKKVQIITHRHRTFLETLQDASVRPVSGFVIAALVLFATFKTIIFLGEGLIENVMEPLFETFYLPLMLRLSEILGPGTFWHDLIIGNMTNGTLDFEEALGLLTTGLFIPFGVVLPYIFSFYLILSFLEDLGYLPRLAVVLDRFMHKVGLHGYSIIPMILGLGCNVPAALAVRNLENRRERFITSVLMAVVIPCMAQLAIIFSLVGKRGGDYLSVVFATLMLIWVVLGVLTDRTLKGYTPSMLIEIPPYRIPNFPSMLKKLKMRIEHFIAEAVPLLLIGIIFVNMLYFTGVIETLARAVSPVVTGIMGLPGESVSTMLVGFLRKDVAVVMLEPLGLTAKQMVIGSTVLAVYFPCFATFMVLLKELGVSDMAKATVIMLTTAIVTGGLLNLVLDTVLSPLMTTVAFIAAALFIAFRFGGGSEEKELHDIDMTSAKDGNTIDYNLN